MTESTSHGAACLRAHGEVLGSAEDATTVVHYCPLDQKVFLIGRAAAVHRQNDHFVGWPAVLLRLPHLEFRSVAAAHGYLVHFKKDWAGDRVRMRNAVLGLADKLGLEKLTASSAENTE